MALTDKLSAIGDAIREKTGTTDLIPLSDMPESIRNIQSGGGKYAPRSVYGYFFYKYKGTELDYEVANLDTSNMTSLYQMFGNCSNLISLNLCNWNTNNITDMSRIFYSCNALANLDVSGWYTNNVTDMSSMFDFCRSLTDLDLSNFITSNVTNMSRMFYYCEKLRKLDIRNFTFDKVTSYSTMFENVPKDCLIIVKGDTEKQWIATNFSTLTNVKTLAEYQAEGGV